MPQAALWPKRLERCYPRSQSDRLGDDHAAWAAEWPPLGLVPAGLAQPRLGIVFAIGLTLTRDDQELPRHEGRSQRLRVTRIHPKIDEQQVRALRRVAAQLA